MTAKEKINMQPYKFAIDGVGIQFVDVYRTGLITGIEYQKKQLLEFWMSKKKSGYVLVYKRDGDNNFERFPFHIVEVFKAGDSQEINLDSWMKARKIL
jgi:hypothetical protein